jgi:DNA invertase Pin-like site-specific DNA recombinase
MSSDRQETSIPAQRTEVQAYAAKHDYKIIREYKDEAISGDATEKRVAFQNMLRDASDKGDFEVILCWDQDRFGRFDPLEAGYWVKPLRDAGVRLETVAQGRIDWNDFAGRIIYAVQQEGKHAFLVDLSRTVIRGILARAREGLWLGGPIPYGYSIESKRLVHGDSQKAEIVQWLFHSYANQTTSLGELARQLNDRGIPAPKGGLWHKTTVYKILIRPVYRGDTTWNRRHDGKYHEVVAGEIKATRHKRRKARFCNPEADWIIVENTHPALVDRDVFFKVRHKLSEYILDDLPS